MEKIFDDIAELIYIADINNYDLLYVNKNGLKHLNIDSFDKKKCFETIYGYKSPCLFCKIKELNTKTFSFCEVVESKQKKLKREILIKYKGRDSKLSVSNDYMIDELYFDFKNIMEMNFLGVKLLKELNNINNPATTMERLLESTGFFLESDEIFLLNIEKDLFIETANWNKDYLIKSKIKNESDFNKKFIKCLLKYGKNNNYIVINKSSIENDENKSFINSFIKYEINELILVKMIIKDFIWGYLIIVNHKKDQSILKNILDTIGYFMNIGIEKTKTNDMLIKLCYFDTLTGLQNRNKYNEVIDDIKQKKISIIGIVYIDMNSLKEINDKKGYMYGDAILLEASQILCSIFDKKEIFRIGGDEFVIVCTDLDEEKFYAKISETKNKFLLSRECSASVGYKWTNNPSNIQKIISEADEMMYKEKRNYYRFNPPTKRYRFTVDNVLGLANKESLINAIENKKFIVYLQPKYSFKNRNLIGSEALIRYRETNGNIISPDQFIPSLEKAKFTKYIDYYVFDYICSLIQEWKKKGTPVFPVSVNFSRFTLLEDNFIEKILDTWKKYRIPKELIEIEITESVGEVEGKDISAILKKIKDAGFSISIDDFGMKYANLSLFSNIDFDVLKIDRSLVQNITNNRKSRFLIKSLVQICNSMNIQLVVEGVETEEQFEILKTLNCYAAQGYLFSKPVPIKYFEENLLTSFF